MRTTGKEAKVFYTKNIRLNKRIFLLAGAGGIEPTLTVLETVVLPLYEAPMIILDSTS